MKSALMFVLACGCGATSRAVDGDAEWGDAGVGGGDASADDAGTYDAGPPLPCEEIAPMQISDEPGGSEGWVGISSNGSGWGVAWWDSREGDALGVFEYELYFTTIDAAGNVPESDVPATEDAGERGVDGNFSLVSNGSGYGLVWAESVGSPEEPWPLFFTRLDAEGRPQGDVVTVSATSAIQPVLAWNGSQYGVTWAALSPSRFVELVRISADGALLDPEPVYVGEGFYPSLSADEDGWGIAYVQNDGSAVDFVRLDADGGLSGSPTRVSAGPAIETTVAADPRGFAVAWSSPDATSDVHFARLDDAGARTGDVVLVTETPAQENVVSLAASQAGWGLAWIEGQSLLRFARIDATGTVGAPTTLSEHAVRGERTGTGVAARGDGYGIAWIDEGSSQWEAYFACVCDAE